MAKPNRREDFLRRQRTRNIIILALIVVAIFVCSTDAFKNFTSHLFGTDKDDKSSSTVEESEVSAETESSMTEELKLEVYCIDVGEGTSTLIRVPQDNAGYRDILIDCGDAENTDKLIGRLEDLGINYLDTVICAHNDEINMGGAAAVVEKFMIKDMYFSKSADGTEPEISNELMTAMSSRQLKTMYISDGDSLNFGDASLSFYSEDDSAGLDYSLEYFGRTLYFTGTEYRCVSIDELDELFSTKLNGMITISIDKNGEYEVAKAKE